MTDTNSAADAARKQRPATHKERKICPECLFDLELEEDRYGKRWVCTGLVDPENDRIELQPCWYSRNFRDPVPRGHVAERRKNKCRQRQN